VLILSAGVGQGHHAAARGLRDELAQISPDTRVIVDNGLGAPHTPLRSLLEHFTRWQLTRCPRVYSFTYAFCVRWKTGRWLTSRLLHRVSHKRLARLIRERRPDVIVSTYPGITSPLGEMRRRGALQIPVCALITDLASLHFWAHPGVDLHLASYAQSLPEIAKLSGGAKAIAIKPPLCASHWRTQSPTDTRRKLGLDPQGSLVLITGGGWGLGDLAGAIEGAIELADVQVVAVCGENDKAATLLSHRYRREPRVLILGYTDTMANLLAAADALIHGTAGVTCLEAEAHRCPVISYGLVVGHIRHNTRAMTDLGLISHATDGRMLTERLREVIRSPPRPVAAFSGRPSAGSVILELPELSLIAGARSAPGRAGTPRGAKVERANRDLSIVAAPPL
jgi:processive 1,2-diacylglycerol beta-glucosyltransferase